MSSNSSTAQRAEKKADRRGCAKRLSQHRINLLDPNAGRYDGCSVKILVENVPL